MLSIIIPTLNEEHYLPLLLESIKRQDFDSHGYEIIIADADSRDKTLKIAQNYNCKVIDGGLPAKGKNKGAKVARGDLLLFLDADTVLPENFLKKAVAEFKKRKINIGGSCLLPYPKNKFFYLLFNLFYNLPIVLLEKILPHASAGILVGKDFFKKLNGFDESIKLAEDHDLARRAKKIGKCGILRSTKIFISDRRFKKEGWLKTPLKYFLCELHMIFIGPVRSDIFKYKFNHYSNDKS